MAMMLGVSEIARRAAQARPPFHIPWRPALMRLADLFNDAAGGTVGVDPCMLAAIVARESGGQNILQIGIPPGPGCGVGLCQITSGVDWSVLSSPAFPGYGPLLDPLTNLRVAAHEFLDPLLRMFPQSHLSAFAAYNLGASAVQRELKLGLSPDSWTTGHDYGTEVFTAWINFNAASMGVNVDWAGHKPASPPRPPTSGPLSRPPDVTPRGADPSELSND